ncbi:hypothetical protein [Paracoccus chinensis]|uniref:Uncharacterized protein n=1 Tax=Paracoccus chinensis TaxID=525640 RepID=A0A1G9MN38_9RHOB|nr:hypothetical protein [Paracoccus chinensis]SDL75692.1 hypothetical protein SAMN04487971_12221 [Paracoccus chinensis]
MPIPQARLRIIPGGLRYESRVIRLDLLRDRIVLQDVTPLAPAQQRRLLTLIAALVRDLGFEPLPGGELQEFPSAGTAFAAHPMIRQSGDMGGSAWVREAADEVVPSPSTDDPVDDPTLPDETEICQDDDGMRLGM